MYDVATLNSLHHVVFEYQQLPTDKTQLLAPLFLFNSSLDSIVKPHTL